MVESRTEQLVTEVVWVMDSGLAGVSEDQRLADLECHRQKVNDGLGWRVVEKDCANFHTQGMLSWRRDQVAGSSWRARPGFKYQEKPTTCRLGRCHLLSVLIGLRFGLACRVSSFKLVPRFLSAPIDLAFYALLSRLFPRLEFNWQVHPHPSRGQSYAIFVVHCHSWVVTLE